MATLIRDPLRLCWLLAALTAAALAVAWAIEALGYAPCPLCLYQRYPYYVAIPLLAAAALAARPRLGLALAALLYVGDAGIALYHSGVELGLLALPAGCAAVGRATSLEELRAQVLGTVPRCDRPEFLLFGLSLANWNALLATTLAALAAAGLCRRPRNGSAR
jgi:disulfide bond formation protein DsbB